MRIAATFASGPDQQSYDSQRAELEDYCRRRGWVDVRWFTDTASGAKSDREGLGDLMEQVRRGKLDAVVTFKLDRLARSLCHLAQLIGELQANRVGLVVPSQAIDTSLGEKNPAAQLQLHLLAAFAEFERSLITERVNAGIAAAKARGVKLGRPAKAARHTASVTAMMAEGLTAAEMSRRLGLPYSTVTELVRELRGAATPALAA